MIVDHPLCKFHPRYKKLGVVYIYFEDDILMFCKVDIPSMKLLFEVFSKFSRVTGLHAIIEKSSIYLSGVQNQVK